MVTGWQVQLDSKQLEQAGITSVVNKPFQIESLLDLIQQVLEGQA